MLVLHQALMARRLAREPAMRLLGPALFDRFCRDLDHNLREMGVADLTVPKKMQAFAEAYLGRARAYDRALSAGDSDACAAAIARNVFGVATAGAGARRLAHYMEQSARALEIWTHRALLQGALLFPDPMTIPIARRRMSALMSDSPTKARPQGSPQDPYPWSVPLRFEDVPETGRHVELAADERTREAVALTAGLAGLPRLEATFDIVRSGRDGLHVTGQVSATVRQTCVVTLELIESEVNEALDLVFRAARAPAQGEEIGVSLDTDETEPLADGVVDLGALATEFLILGIDPYPRKAGAVFEPPPTNEPAGGRSRRLPRCKRNRKTNWVIRILSQARFGARCENKAGPPLCPPAEPVLSPRSLGNRSRRTEDLCQGRLMPQKVRIALDAMGGDHGPSVIVPGAEISLDRHPDTEFLLYGDHGPDRSIARDTAQARRRVAHVPHRCRRQDGRQAERRAAPRTLEIVHVARHGCGQKRRGGCRGVRRQYRRADGDGALQSQDGARHQPPRLGCAVADAAWRIDRA